MYEFECEKGHITEELVPVGTEMVYCKHADCSVLHAKDLGEILFGGMAFRILSPTPTTFVHAGGRKL